MDKFYSVDYGVNQVSCTTLRSAKNRKTRLENRGFVAKIYKWTRNPSTLCFEKEAHRVTPPK